MRDIKPVAVSFETFMEMTEGLRPDSDLVKAHMEALKRNGIIESPKTYNENELIDSFRKAKEANAPFIVVDSISDFTRAKESSIETTKREAKAFEEFLVISEMRSESAYAMSDLRHQVNNHKLKKKVSGIKLPKPRKPVSIDVTLDNLAEHVAQLAEKPVNQVWYQKFNKRKK